MNKVIHGAFRRDLDRFIAALGSFPAGDQRRADEVNTAWANFDDQLTYHHEGEHTTAWPALQQVGVSPDLVDHPAIVEMAKTFAKVSPARGGRFFAWLLDGATPDQRAALGNAVPGPVLKIITGIFGRGDRKHVAPVWSH